MQAELEAVLRGLPVPPEICETLVLVPVPYRTFDGSHEEGTLIVHRDLAEEVRAIFEGLVAADFPIEKIRPLTDYGWDDEASMQDNNTTAFNYRTIIGIDVLSNHALGRAIDLNPRQNPYHARDGRTHPANASYTPDTPGTLTKDSPAVGIFKQYGWAWLGERPEYPDFQHFEKPL